MWSAVSLAKKAKSARSNNKPTPVTIIGENEEAFVHSPSHASSLHSTLNSTLKSGRRDHIDSMDIMGSVRTHLHAEDSTWRQLIGDLQLEFERLQMENRVLSSANRELRVHHHSKERACPHVAANLPGDPHEVIDAAARQPLRVNSHVDVAGDNIVAPLEDSANDEPGQRSPPDSSTVSPNSHVWRNELRTSRNIQAGREMRIEFGHLCKDRRDSISAEEIFEMQMTGMVALWSESTRDKSIAMCKQSIEALHTEFVEVPPSATCEIDPERIDEIQCQTYGTLFQSDGFSSLALSDAHKLVIQQMCQVIINRMVAYDIALVTGVEINAMEKPENQYERFLRFLDAFVLFLILCNVMTLTISLDIYNDWAGWDGIETSFIFIFLLEIFVRIALTSLQYHFCGPDRGWNMFDVFVVTLGLADVLMSAAGEIPRDAAQVTSLRILRLLRGVKMVRVLRLKVLKELRLMVDGLVSGLRTICWAFVFLFFFVLTLGITTKQFLAVQPTNLYCEGLPWGCSASQEHLAAFREELFGNVPRCMFTIFRCFVADGCVSLDGTPIMPFIWDEFGWFVCIVYVMCFCFLTFGLFNLIMATIVESTMQVGKRDDVKRRRERQKEYLETAQTVQELVKLLCCQEKQSQRQYRKFRQMFVDETDSMEAIQTSRATYLQSRISTSQFLEALDDPEVCELLEKLGVTTTDPHNYLEAFDANADGLLSTAELIKGLLKLRGSVEKADIVAGLMVARDTQKSIRSIEAMLVRSYTAQFQKQSTMIA